MRFSIADLERLTGIRSHTLRTWEQRYGVPKPARTGSNTRYYSLEELRSILSIAVLNRRGHRISHIISLSAAEVKALLRQVAEDGERQQMAIAELLLAMYSFEIELFEELLDGCFLSWPADEVLNLVIHPFLRRTELLWTGKRRAEEHLVVPILRKKINYALEKQGGIIPNGKLMLLFRPGTAGIDLGFLYTAYRLRTAGARVINLGNDISVQNLKMVFEKLRPDFLFTYLDEKCKFDLSELVGHLEEHLPHARLVVSGCLPTATIPSSGTTAYLDDEEALSFLVSRQHS